jgi:ABC-type multidrug transport system fused ATPase/permease subunit
MAALDRIFELMDQEPEITDAPEAHSINGIRGDVEFKDVCFSYNDHQSVLKDLNFKAVAGMRIALVGASGSGKSTVVSLIPRFYEVNKGSITIDGHDLRRIKLKSLRAHIGMVLQEPVLFSGTVKENILYSKPEATPADVIEACKMANAYDFISELPNGLDTEIGERGVLLSGGQKQRLTIARAFLKDPKILILDEATSSLDSESEALIQEALARLMIGRTTFIIAHRLSTILHADKIFVLANGRIVEEGTHAELLINQNHYFRFYRKQNTLPLN